MNEHVIPPRILQGLVRRYDPQDVDAIAEMAQAQTEDTRRALFSVDQQPTYQMSATELNLLRDTSES